MGNDLKEIASKRIKDLRIAHGYTMESLANIVGVSKSTVAKWENGYVSNMRQDKVAVLSKLYNVSPAYIMGYELEKKETDSPKVLGIRPLENKKENEEEEEQLERIKAYYSQLTPEQKNLVDNMIQVFLKKQ